MIQFEKYFVKWLVINCNSGFKWEELLNSEQSVERSVATTAQWLHLR